MENPEKLWFQKEEFDKIIAKSQVVIEKAALTKSLPGKKYCTRGLERLSPESSDQIMTQREDAWDAVLYEQDQQREEGTFDEDYIADLYKSSTQLNQDEAVERAQQDAAEVEEYLQLTRKEMMAMQPNVSLEP